jgi:hypothetical protein
MLRAARETRICEIRALEQSNRFSQITPFYQEKQGDAVSRPVAPQALTR